MGVRPKPFASILKTNRSLSFSVALFSGRNRIEIPSGLRIGFCIKKAPLSARAVCFIKMRVRCR